MVRIAERPHTWQHPGQDSFTLMAQLRPHREAPREGYCTVLGWRSLRYQIGHDSLLVRSVQMATAAYADAAYLWCFGMEKTEARVTNETPGRDKRDNGDSSEVIHTDRDKP